MRRRKTLASVSHTLSELISTMGSTPLYFTAGYNNKDHFDVVSEKITEVVKTHNKVLGYFGIKQLKDGEYRLGVVVYPDEATRLRDEKKGVSYDRVCF